MLVQVFSLRCVVLERSKHLIAIVGVIVKEVLSRLIILSRRSIETNIYHRLQEIVVSLWLRRLRLLEHLLRSIDRSLVHRDGIIFRLAHLDRVRVEVDGDPLISLPFSKDDRLCLLRPVRFEWANICRVLLILITTFNRSRGYLISTDINLQSFIVLLLTTLLFALIFSVLFLELVLLATLLLGISRLLLAFLHLHQC